MPPIDRVLAFAVTAFVIIVIPGPSVLFVVSRGVALGRRAALATVVGNTAGEMVQIVAVAFGVGSVVRSSVVVFHAMRLIGAAYLVYLGSKMVLQRRAVATVFDVAATPRSTRRIWREGLVVGATNPKTAVFFAAVVPGFTDPARGMVWLQMLILGLIFAGIALVSDSTWGLAAGTVRGWLARSPRRLERLGGAGGLAIVGLGLRLAFTGRKD